MEEVIVFKYQPNGAFRRDTNPFSYVTSEWPIPGGTPYWLIRARHMKGYEIHVLSYMKGEGNLSIRAVKDSNDG